MFAGGLEHVIVASPKVRSAQSRAGTNADLWPAPFRSGAAPPSVRAHPNVRRTGGTMRRRRNLSSLALALLGILAAVAVGAVASDAGATAPGENGRIAFRRYSDNDRTAG